MTSLQLMESKSAPDRSLSSDRHLLAPLTGSGILPNTFSILPNIYSHVAFSAEVPGYIRTRFLLVDATKFSALSVLVYLARKL